MPFVRECGLIVNMEAPWPSDARYLRTGPLLVDLCYRCIECDGTRQELQQRVFDLLLVFLAKPNALHTRAALFQRLWPGVIVEDANLSQSIWLLRKALGKRGKYWIRTVAKGGYVFEPPGPVEWLATHPDETSGDASDDTSVGATNEVPADGEGARGLAAPSAPDPSGIPITTSPAPAPAAPVRRIRRPRWPRRTAATALVAAAALLLGLPWLRARQAPAPVAPTALAIAVVEVEDPAAAARWPARLLRDWLRLKLADLPEVALLTEADLAAGTASDPPQLVLISAAEAPDDPDMVVVQARVQAPSQTQGAERRFEQRGPPAKVAAMVDALSNQVLAQLVPTRRGPWPPLTLGAAAARRYAEATGALDRRDWPAAARLLERTIELAPRFGLARLQLAQAQQHLSQASAAVVQMESALALLQPLPADVTEALQARRLALEPARYREAEAAFARLSERHAGRKEHLIERARLLLTAGEPQQARTLLARMDWGQAPADTRIAQRLVASDIDAALGDVDAARGHAGIAERLARQAGEGWNLERAAALMDLARLDLSQEAGSAQYREAARLLEAGGDQIGALYAQFLAESAQPPDATGEQRLNALLAKAREGGYPRLEIGILQVVARRFREAGDYARSRDYLEQAWTTAQAAGDTVARDTLDLLLAGADLADLRLDGVQARVERLSKARPQGARAMLVALHQATLAGIRGQPTAAIAILDRAERSLGNQGRLPTAFSGLNCTRASYRLITGDLARAREDWRLCEAPSSEGQRLLVALGRAQTELMAGDRGAARALLEPLGERIDALPEGPDRWALSLEQAALLGRAGDPQRAGHLYARIAQRVPQQGTTHLRAALETGLAENEAALGRWASSQTHLQAARRLLPEDAWSYQARLRLVEIVGARAAGHDADAVGLLRSLHTQAHRRRDVGMMLEIHTLLPDGFEQGDCTRAQREHLVAQTGMRGAGTDWLAKTDAIAARAPAPL